MIGISAASQQLPRVWGVRLCQAIKAADDWKSFPGLTVLVVPWPVISGIQASLSTRLWPALCPTRVPLLPVARLLPCVSGVALGPSQREAPSKVSWPQDLQLHSLALVLSQPCTPTQQVWRA